MIAIIIPCYNEEYRLKTDAFTLFASRHKDIELWFANDGSIDNTLQIINNLADSMPDQIHVFNLNQNVGKAEALRQVFLHTNSLGKYTHIGFIDADLSSPLDEIVQIQNLFQTNTHLLLVAAVRIKILGNIVVRKSLRHYISRIFATFYNTVLRIPNYDTQCGLKVFHKSIIDSVFGAKFISKWLFDIELFLRIQGLIGRSEYEKKIREMPVNEWREVGGSKLKFTDFLKAPYEVLRIRNKYKDIINSRV
jgi:dolichyl-phosphate beta-glucosyltransferase